MWSGVTRVEGEGEREWRKEGIICCTVGFVSINLKQTLHRFLSSSFIFLAQTTAKMANEHD